MKCYITFDLITGPWRQNEEGGKGGVGGYVWPNGLISDVDTTWQVDSSRTPVPCGGSKTSDET